MRPNDDTQFEGTATATHDENAVHLDTAEPLLVHIIPQAHIDLAWQWTAADGVEMVLETFRRHVELLEQNARRTYAQSQLAAYEIVERLDPDLFKRLRVLVANGQWEIVGGEWVEPDRALPSGESLVRQLVEGQTYAESRFGVRARVAWSPDSFTWHPPNLPQLLREAGLRFQVIKRPREKYMHMPLVPFRWKGLDGTEILTYRTNNKGSGLPQLSEGTPDPPEGRTPLHEYADAFDKIGFKHLWGPRGVGDTGGVNEYPPPARGTGWTSEYSTPSRYADALETWDRADKLPCIEGAIGPVMTGCLTTHHEMKSLNRHAENTLLSAETALAIQSILADRDPLRNKHKMSIHSAWRKTLFNQFHDTVTGVGIPETHSEAAHDYREAIRLGSECRLAALRTIAHHVGNASGGPEVLVFNDLGWRRTAVVETDAIFGSDSWTESPDQLYWEAVAPDGTASPVTIHTERRVQSWRRHRCSFIAHDMPGMGYRVYRLRPVDRPDYQVRTAESQIMTDHLTVRFDTRAGTIRTIINRTDAVTFDTGLCAPRLLEEGEYFLDYGVEHRAWYLGLTGKEKTVEFVGLREVEVHPAYASYDLIHRFGDSELTQRVVVRPHLPYVEVAVTIDWHEVEHLLRLSFPTEMASATAAFDASYGVVEREPDGVEIPMHMFCSLSDGSRGISILNDGKYGAMADGDTLNISAVRCSTLPDPRSDRGTVTFRYAIMQHPGTWRDAGVPAEAFSFNRPLIGMPLPQGVQGAGAGEWSFMESQTDTVLPVVLKHRVDDNGYAVRLYNACSGETTANLSVAPSMDAPKRGTILEEADDGSQVNLEAMTMRPYEVATLLFDR